jgi:hypothetical protein
MNKEICTLKQDGVPLTFYISFDKTLSKFDFLPGLGNAFAPSFTVVKEDHELISWDSVPEELLEQAKQKIEAILDSGFFRE